MKETRTHLVGGQPVAVETGSGNVFADLGLPAPEEMMLKANLSLEIRKLIEAKGLTQSAAASVVGLSQPKVNDLLHGRLKGYSVERLLAVVNRLGRNVELRISAKDVAPDKARTVVAVR